LLELIKQRRRWLNGSFFALVFYISRFTQLLGRSDHSLCRRFWLTVQFMYQASARRVLLTPSRLTKLGLH
jgi:chitin synthase